VAFLRKLERLDLVARKLRAGTLRGERRSAKRGQAVAFTACRLYRSVRTQSLVATTGASRVKSGERHGGSDRPAGVGMGGGPQFTGHVGKFKPVTAAWAEF